MQILRLGSRGLDVQRVQQALNRCMLPPNNKFTSPPIKRLVEDGSFGAKTQSAVKEYQRLNNIKTDGVIGPITSYFIFPFISFEAQLAGRGLIRGKAEQPGQVLVANRLSANRSLFASPLQSGGLKAKQTAADGKEEEKDGLTFELSVGAGAKVAFKPWFVLKPNEPPEGNESEAALAVGATILRLKGFEFGGELEFSKQVSGEGGSWKWEGAIKGAYTNIKTKDERFGVSPIVDISVKQGVNLGLGVGAEASVQIIKDRLELKVGGKVAMEWDPREANVKAGLEVGAGLELKFDVTRLFKK